MSSYLVAYANGEFEFIEDSYVSPLSGKTRPLRIYGKYRNYFQLHGTDLCTYSDI